METARVPALKHYDIVTVCSDLDKRYLAAENVRVVPNGFEPRRKSQADASRSFATGFIETLVMAPM
jgi:hypothetical protein